MAQLRILIIEDEAIIAEDMRLMLEDLGYHVVGLALDYEEGIELLETSNPDIVLTDIALGGPRDGVDLARIIRSKYMVPFIFVTSHSDRTTIERAKQHLPNGYLVKPFDACDLFTSIEVALANYSATEEREEGAGELLSESGYLVKDSIYIKDSHLFVKVPIKQILWVKSDANYLDIHTIEKRYVIRSSLKDFVEKLPSSDFFRIHKSFAVNLSHIDAIDNVSVLVSGEVIPMGRNYRELLLRYLNTA